MIGHGLGSDAIDESYNFLRVRNNARGSYLRASFDSRLIVLRMAIGQPSVGLLAEQVYASTELMKKCPVPFTHKLPPKTI
jgi:hypothetical protein